MSTSESSISISSTSANSQTGNNLSVFPEKTQAAVDNKRWWTNLLYLLSYIVGFAGIALTTEVGIYLSVFFVPLVIFSLFRLGVEFKHEDERHRIFRKIATALTCVASIFLAVFYAKFSESVWFSYLVPASLILSLVIEFIPAFIDAWQDKWRNKWGFYSVALAAFAVATIGLIPNLATYILSAAKLSATFSPLYFLAAVIFFSISLNLKNTQEAVVRARGRIKEIDLMEDSEATQLKVAVVPLDQTLARLDAIPPSNERLIFHWPVSVLRFIERDLKAYNLDTLTVEQAQALLREIDRHRQEAHNKSIEDAARTYDEEKKAADALKQQADAAILLEREQLGSEQRAANAKIDRDEKEQIVAITNDAEKQKSILTEQYIATRTWLIETGSDEKNLHREHNTQRLNTLMGSIERQLNELDAKRREDIQAAKASVATKKREVDYNLRGRYAVIIRKEQEAQQKYGAALERITAKRKKTTDSVDITVGNATSNAKTKAQQVLNAQQAEQESKEKMEKERAELDQRTQLAPFVAKTKIALYKKTQVLNIVMQILEAKDFESLDRLLPNLQQALIEASSSVAVASFLGNNVALEYRNGNFSNTEDKLNKAKINYTALLDAIADIIEARKQLIIDEDKKSYSDEAIRGTSKASALIDTVREIKANVEGSEQIERIEESHELENPQISGLDNIFRTCVAKMPDTIDSELAGRQSHLASMVAYDTFYVDMVTTRILTENEQILDSYHKKERALQAWRFSYDQHLSSASSSQFSSLSSTSNSSLSFSSSLSSAPSSSTSQSASNTSSISASSSLPASAPSSSLSASSSQSVESEETRQAKEELKGIEEAIARSVAEETKQADETRDREIKIAQDELKLAQETYVREENELKTAMESEIRSLDTSISAGIHSLESTVETKLALLEKKYSEIEILFKTTSEDLKGIEEKLNVVPTFSSTQDAQNQINSMQQALRQAHDLAQQKAKELSSLFQLELNDPVRGYTKFLQETDHFITNNIIKRITDKDGKYQRTLTHQPPASTAEATGAHNVILGYIRIYTEILKQIQEYQLNYYHYLKQKVIYGRNEGITKTQQQANRAKRIIMGKYRLQLQEKANTKQKTEQRYNEAVTQANTKATKAVKTKEFTEKHRLDAKILQLETTILGFPQATYNHLVREGEWEKLNRAAQPLPSPSHLSTLSLFSSASLHVSASASLTSSSSQLDSSSATLTASSASSLLSLITSPSPLPISSVPSASASNSNSLSSSDSASAASPTSQTLTIRH